MTDKVHLYGETGTSVGRRSPPTGSTEQPHVPARREVNLKDRGEDGSPARVVAWQNEAPDRAIYGFTPSKHASGRVVDQVHVVEAGGEPHAGALARAGSGTHAPAHV